MKMEQTTDLNCHIKKHVDLATKLSSMVDKEFGVEIIKEIGKDIRCDRSHTTPCIHHCLRVWNSPSPPSEVVARFLDRLLSCHSHLRHGRARAV